MKRTFFDLKGQVALITGCSAGHGVEMAKALANQGCSIVPLARRKKKLDQVAQMLDFDYGVETYPIACDITYTDAVDQAVDEVMDRFGRIDILVNNAGVGEIMPAEDMTDEQFIHELNIDLFGAFRVTRAVANRSMLPRRYGRIINVASIYGLVGTKVAGSTPYHTAKGGMVNMTRALAAEWSDKGITVNAICPGFFNNPLTQNTLDSPDFKAYANMVIPAGRYGHPRELDTCTIFLAARETSYVTGAMIPVDGGYTCV